MEGIIYTNSVSGELKVRLEEFSDRKIFVVADSNTARYCLPETGLDVPAGQIYVLPEGEGSKNLQEVAKVWRMLMENGARRDSLVINVGGGVVTDLGGFAASCYKRGIRCMNIPTTLLAQVDASVGGKTGVDFCGLKNEIGTFSIPSCVFIDNSFLKTLPYAQIISGFAEMLKHALLMGPEELETVMKADLESVSSPDFLPVLKRSVSFKGRIVSEDPKEKGIRKCLNLGHTVGHAVESVALEKGTEWYHGYSVAYGLIAAMYLSVRKFGFDTAVFDAVSAFVRKIYPPLPAGLDKEELYTLMLHDKKNDGNGVNFTLLEAPGSFVVNCHCNREEIFAALENLLV